MCVVLCLFTSSFSRLIYICTWALDILSHFVSITAEESELLSTLSLHKCGFCGPQLVDSCVIGLAVCAVLKGRAEKNGFLSRVEAQSLFFPPCPPLSGVLSGQGISLLWLTPEMGCELPRLCQSMSVWLFFLGLCEMSAFVIWMHVQALLYWETVM